MSTMPIQKTTKIGCTLVATLCVLVCVAFANADIALANSNDSDNERGFFTRVSSFLGMADDGDISSDRDGHILPTIKPEISASITSELADIEPAAGGYQGHIDKKIDVEMNSRSALDPRDAKLYQQIFQLQQNGNWKQTDTLIKKLSDHRLMGHVLYQRYMHPTKYKSTFKELNTWVSKYADHAGAKDVYRLAKARKPQDFEGTLHRPKTGDRIEGSLAEIRMVGKRYKATKKRSYHERASIRQLERQIERHVRKGSPTFALKVLNTTKSSKYLDEAEYDQLLAEIAESYYHAGLVDKAYTYASQAADRSGTRAPLAGWVAGLSSWRKGNFEEAADYFEHTGSSEYASGWTQSAGAYWAARSHMRARNFWHVSPWLKKAAEHHRTFYGLIATRALGRKIDMNWFSPIFGDQHAATLIEYKSGWRALALIDLGEVDKAEAELIHLNPGRRNVALQEALIALAQTYQLPALSLRLGHAYPDRQGRVYEAALYPLMSWEPRSGYSIDRALIHAFIRQESRFDVDAQSHTGATGLMQLMLQTASYVDGKQTFRSHNRYLLEHPSTNLDLGQKYIKKLLRYRNVEGDLLSLATAYNAGPGNLTKWKANKELSADPLLFIESIPLSETRGFVERVLSNFWIYRMRLNQSTPSLNDIAQDQWPIYRAQDEDTLRLASLN